MEKQANNHKLSFPVAFEKIAEVDGQDTRFTKVKCWLMHTGKNYNQSEFTREVIENAIPTLSYIPIVGFLEENEFGEKDFSDHRYIITKDNGEVKRVYKGSAYGVMLSSEDNNVHFETKICSDGIEREFLVAFGVMWNFLEDSSKVMNRDLIKDHSIELDENSVDGYMDENNIFHFTKFSFRAACVLGGSAQPAMIGSTVEVQFEMTDFVKNLQNELNYKYSEFTRLVNEAANQTFTEQKLVDDEEINKGGMEDMQNTDFSTVLQQFQDISNTIAARETVRDCWGYDCPRYYAVDVQENEVIVVDSKDNYNYYGFAFSVNGDSVEIDFENAKRKKIVYEDFVDGVAAPEGGFNFGKHISEIEETAFAKVNEANEKVSAAETDKATAETNYTQIKADYDDIKPKYDEYVRAEEQRQVDELNAQKETKFAEYEDMLSDNADFAALKERKDELSVQDIDKECAVLYVKASRAKMNFSKSNSASGIVEVMDEHEDAGFVVTKYGNIPVRK